MLERPEAVSIYIDGSNLYHSIRQYFGEKRLDLIKFRDKLAAGRRLVRTYYYDAPFPADKDSERARNQQRFHNFIQTQSYIELRLGRLIFRDYPRLPPFEKGIDIKIATDMLVQGFRDNYDVALLVSGDTDFVDAIQALKDYGKHVEVALFGQAWTSQALRNVADRTIIVDEPFLADCWMVQLPLPLPKSEP